ncbi:MAG: hypothetical protein QOH93_1569 [Chloroflexia bacterium]|jgi:hypothetical protein|nr:hypothetical protein [Chloroflexia bacterium]
MNAQNNASHEWEYIEVQVTDPAPTIRRHRKKGWDLVDVVAVPITPAAPNKPNRSRRAWLPLAIVVGLILLLVFFFTLLGTLSRSQDITLSKLVQDTRAGRVTLIVASEDSNTLTIYYGDPSSRDTPVANTVKEPGSTIQDYLLKAGVSVEKLPEIEVQRSSSLGSYLGIVGFCLPPIVFVAVVAWVGWRFLSRQQQWSTLLIFRRPVQLGVDTEEPEVPRQEE